MKITVSREHEVEVTYPRRTVWSEGLGWVTRVEPNFVTYGETVNESIEEMDALVYRTLGIPSQEDKEQLARDVVERVIAFGGTLVGGGT